MVELEPMTLLPALAMVTRHVGLVTTASTTYNEPYNLARKFATLDLISKGRAGWNVVASWSELEAQNFGLETTLDYDTRYARSAEFVEVVKGLWDSWDDGALVFDKAAGRYFDEAKMHVLDHQGRFFKVRGPLNVAGMPQGHPVIVQAGASEQGRELGAATAEVIYAISGSLEDARAYYADVKGRMAKYGREPDDLKIMPALCPVVGRTRAEAQAKYDELQALIDPLAGLGALYSSFGDLSGYPLDEPVPDGALGSQEMRSLSALLVERVRREKPTIRELYLRAGLTGSARIGTPADIADAMQEWFEAAACDGFNITPATLPGGGEDFVEMVVPELQRRGLFRTEYEGRTLRENLGLRPVDRAATVGTAKPRSKPCQSSTSRFIPSIEIIQAGRGPVPRTGSSPPRARKWSRRWTASVSTARSWCRRSAPMNTIRATRSRSTTPSRTSSGS